jgi:hypothetical protein
MELSDLEGPREAGAFVSYEARALGPPTASCVLPPKSNCAARSPALSGACPPFAVLAIPSPLSPERAAGA